VWTGSDKGENLARFLGAFSIGLGLAEVLVPRQLAKFIGIKPTKTTSTVLRILGAREIMAGLGVLSVPRPRGWVGARVAGDVIDLACLAGALASGPRKPYRTLAATAAVLGVTALDVMATEELTEARNVPTPKLGPEFRNTPIYHSIVVEAPIEEVYAFWRDLGNLPSFMKHLVSVEEQGDKRSRWRARGPDGIVVEWDAEIVDEVENERLAWRSVGDADVYHAGAVRFEEAPAGRGTIVTVEMRYAPPGGKIGAALLRIMHREPGQQVAEELHNFKQLLETGEILLSDATVVPGPHPARPPTREELQR
jgi:uncharacterized membrane protein